MAHPRLTLMMFPQRWDPDAASLEIRIAALPFTDPLSPLAPAQPAFADTNLSLRAMFIPGLVRLPKSVEALAPVTLPVPARPNRRTLFEHLAARFQIQAPASAPPRPLGSRRVKKHLPLSYRQAFDFTGPQHRFVSTDHTYRCEFESAQKLDVNAPAPETRVSWGEVMGYLLRNALLAETAGLIFRFDVAVPDAFMQGGWLYADIAAGTTFAGLADLRRYAARIPALPATPRPIFAAIQFPVDDPAASDDARVFVEAESYDDGFAKIVHGAQPLGVGPVDTEARGLAPIRDRGIRLGWDDEQIATWLNRQVGLDPFSGAAPTLAAPISVLAYRVDVRKAGETKWHSLMRVQGPIRLDDVVPPAGLAPLDLGMFSGELGVETIPLNLTGAALGDFWLPAYFASWAGGSLALSDPVGLAVDNCGDVVAAQRYVAAGADAVALRYGHDYEFRVRLMDLASGGADQGEDAVNPALAPVAPVAFRRYVPPGAPVVTRADAGAADGPPTELEVKRPRLPYPDILFASGPDIIPELLVERDRILSLPATEPPEPVGLPDPDVASVRISVAVRQLAMDEAEFATLYVIERGLPSDLAQPLELEIEYVDTTDVAAFTAPADGDPLRIPTARDVRLSFESVGKPDTLLKYFGSHAASVSARSSVLTFRAPSSNETNLLVPQEASHRVRAIYLQPDPPVTGFSRDVQAFQGIDAPPELQIPGRLARALELDWDGLTFRGKPGRRTVFGASAALRHALAPDHASITFSSQSDLVRQWIIAIRLKLDRDWTWDGAAEQGLRFLRAGNIVGTVSLPRVVNRNALVAPDRAHTDVVFFDAVDPKPLPGDFPKEVEAAYTCEPRFRDTVTSDGPIGLPKLRLPVTTPPTQTPKIVTAGIGFSPFAHDERYSSTSPRRRALWLEFDRPPADDGDRYFCRVLANAPDPMLIETVDPLPEPPEPDLAIDPEWIRVIVPAQPADESGLDAMQEMIASPASPVHFVVPLPPGLDDSALELFGFFTYELRLGHGAGRWSTAQGRFGPPLRVTGVQHPAPPLACQVSRAKDGIEIIAPYATPIDQGRLMRPPLPHTDMWVMLYAQVLQLDGQAWRNVLLAHRRAERTTDDRNPDFPRLQTALELATGRFDQRAIEQTLELLGLPGSSPLSVLVVELLPEIALTSLAQAPRRDPLEESLGEVRILRSSPLVPVPPLC